MSNEEITPVGIAVAQKIGRDYAPLGRQKRNDFVIQKRPSRNSMQKNDRVAIAEIGTCHAERLMCEAVEFGDLLPLAKGLMR